jgi:hypothetical protein
LVGGGCLDLLGGLARGVGREGEFVAVGSAGEKKSESNSKAQDDDSYQPFTGTQKINSSLKHVFIIAHISVLVNKNIEVRRGMLILRLPCFALVVY